jgi:hypothetical protein
MGTGAASCFLLGAEIGTGAALCFLLGAEMGTGAATCFRGCEPRSRIFMTCNIAFPNKITKFPVPDSLDKQTNKGTIFY